MAQRYLVWSEITPLVRNFSTSGKWKTTVSFAVRPPLMSLEILYKTNQSKTHIYLASIIPFVCSTVPSCYMDSEICAWAHPCLPTDSFSSRCHSVDIISNPISYPGTFLRVPRGPPTLEEARTNSLYLDTIPHTLATQVNAEVG
jgi:hypothetical protein